ncbi:hypothetical protein [Rhodovulum marinum]|uniref:hypothetical protein n=1 Tax=Rhodovulum marinum TaxID=320662 RepID=UPI00104F7CBE|nr:hypothetical protein [Rhodovulum marinum]
MRGAAPETGKNLLIFASYGDFWPTLISCNSAGRIGGDLPICLWTGGVDWPMLGFVLATGKPDGEKG